MTVTNRRLRRGCGVIPAPNNYAKFGSDWQLRWIVGLFAVFPAAGNDLIDVGDVQR